MAMKTIPNLVCVYGVDLGSNNSKTFVSPGLTTKRGFLLYNSLHFLRSKRDQEFSGTQMHTLRKGQLLDMHKEIPASILQKCQKVEVIYLRKMVLWL